jgi:hypothetical protein
VLSHYSVIIPYSWVDFCNDDDNDDDDDDGDDDDGNEEKSRDSTHRWFLSDPSLSWGCQQGQTQPCWSAVCVCVCVSVYVGVRVCVCVCVRVYLCTRVYLCASVCVYVMRVCGTASMHVCLRMWATVGIFLVRCNDLISVSSISSICSSGKVIVKPYQ